jgi:Heterokaryon incompatibility protein (HET)
MKTLNSLRKDGHVSFCQSDTGEAALPTNSGDATLDNIYLTLPQNHIRLLRLQNTVDAIATTGVSESLQCELAVFSLDSVPSYVALSYCWGDRGTTYPLSCMGQELQIQENLHAVLTRLQATGFQDWLWIDAVCINQYSDDEKNHQIPLMRYIFSQAHMVHIPYFHIKLLFCD